MIVKAIKTSVFQEGEDLFKFIVGHVKRLHDKSVFVITSKIVALGEGRVRSVKSKREKIKIIKEESEYAIHTKHAWLTIKDGFVMASAGIDESNADGKIILLPQDSYQTAREIRKKLIKHYGIKDLGIIITDSRTEPLRSGVTGKSIGYAGFEGVKSYVGKPDIFGRTFKFSRVSVADSLASGAVFEMGEGNEQKPLCIVEGAEIKFTGRRIDPSESKIELKDDMYRPLFKKYRK